MDIIVKDALLLPLILAQFLNQRAYRENEFVGIGTFARLQSVHLSLKQSKRNWSGFSQLEK